MEFDKSETQKVPSNAIEEAKSSLRMNNFHFSSIELSYDGTKIERQEACITAMHEISNQNADRITLTIEIIGGPGSFSLSVSAQATFTIDGESDISQNILIKRNAISIMFPYLRSEVTLLTSQPGMVPIVLPPLNINNLMDKAEISQ